MLQTPANSSAALRILIADDHEMARAGIRSLIGNEPGITIVGEATDGLEALVACASLQPDIVLLDVRMPNLDGLSTNQTIRQDYPHIKVIMLTMHENLDYLVEAIKVGAMGYVLKDATRRELISAIRKVGRGETYMNPELMAQALRRLALDSTVAAPVLAEDLTPRELDVIRLLVQGQTNRQIGANLHISPGTAKVHVEHIIAKLGAADRTQAAVRAIELHLV